MANAAKDIYTTIDELADEMGTAATYRETIEREISDLELELTALDQMAEDATDRAEYERIVAQRKDCELDFKLAKNRLRLFGTSPRIDPETFEGLMSQLSAEVDRAAALYREKVESPLAEIVKADDDFDASAARVMDAVRKLRAVLGPIADRDWDFRRMLYRFELGTVRARAYCDGTIVYPILRDALNLADTAKQPPFDTH